MDELLSEVDEFRTLHSMSESAFGRMAVNDHKLLTRIRESKNGATIGTIDRVRIFMANYCAPGDAPSSGKSVEVAGERAA